MDENVLCRICTKCSKSGQSSYLFSDDKNKLIIQIQEITGILLLNSTQMPGLICKPCEDDLGRAYEFRERCIYAQEYFNSLECKEIPKRTDDHFEAAFTDDDAKDEPLIDVGDAYFIKGESFDEIQGEIVVESCSRYEGVNTELEDKLTLGDVHEDEPVESHEDHNELYSPFTKKTKKKLKSKTKNLIAKPIKVKEKADCTNIASSTKPKKTKRIKLDNQDEKNRTFICDQCGNYFTSRNHFRIHLLRHTGEKRFQCELCADKFFTNSELNRHMRKHTGERPFACKHCGRRFTDYSTRVKHERTHTNERPFACTQCSKAFTTSYILKNHMLVHTGERSFKCDLCVRSFQRQTHLVVHYKSIMHQQNEEKIKQGSCRATTNDVDSNEFTMLKY